MAMRRLILRGSSTDIIVVGMSMRGKFRSICRYDQDGGESVSKDEDMQVVTTKSISDISHV